jgi:hypothetical protein
MRLPLQAVLTGAIASASVALLFLGISASGPTEIDPTSAFRGSLGASLGDLSLSDNLGRLSLLLNVGFALLFGAFASLAAAGLRRDRINDSRHRREDHSGQTAHLT